MLQQTDPGTGLTFRETMAGPFAMGVTDPDEGARAGEHADTRMTLHATVTVDDIDAFLAEPRPPGRLTGELELPGVRRRVPFDNGVFRLFPPSDRAYRTLMIYELGFTHDGVRYHFAGFKAAGERPFVTQLWGDTTTLRTRLHRGAGTSGEVVGAGVLRLSAAGLARLVASMRTPRASSVLDSARATGGYAWLFARTFADTYLPRLP